MEPFDYLRAVRRNWRIVGAAVLIALLAAFFTRSIEPAGGAARSYEATTVLIANTFIRTQGDPSSPATAAALVTTPPVPERVAESIGFDGDPEALASQVSAAVDQDSGLINITATSREADRATELADAFAGELLTLLGELEQVNVDTRTEELRKEIRGIERRIEDVQDPDSDEARNLQTQLDQLTSEMNQLSSQTVDPGFTVLSPAVAKRVTTAGFSAPRSFSIRLIIAGVIGLLAGIIIAIIVGRLDTRIRTKRAAEDRFSAPVLAEVPVIRGRNRRGIVATTQPASRAAEEFRLLGAELSLSMAGSNGNGSPGPHRSSAVLVTSAGPSEGKTTVVANLATTLSEMGKKVLVLSCDFHRPTVHSLFGIENERGLADALASADGGPVLAGVVQETSGHVDVVTSGRQPESSGELLSSDRMRLALKEARGLADIVLLDTPPILVSSDATHLLPQVDAVLLVARAARTEADLAERASELLGRMGAPVRGVVLNRASETPRPRGARGYYNRGPAKETLADDVPDDSISDAAPDDRVESDRG